MNKVSEILTSEEYLTGKFLGSSGATRKEILNCKHEKSVFTMKIIPTNRPDIDYFPKYISQIKEKCADCDKFIRFSPQYQDLIDQFNEKLEGIRCV